MSLTTAIGAGGYQEAFVALFISKVRKAATAKNVSIAKLFAESPHLKKRFEQISNSKKPLWERSVTDNVFNSFDKQIFAGTLSESERNDLRVMFEHCYRPELRAEKRSRLKPRYKKGPAQILKAIEELAAQSGVLLSHFVADPGQFVHSLEQATHDLTSHDRWGEAATLLDASLRFLLSPPGSLRITGEEAYVSTVSMVCHLAIMVFTTIHDAPKLRETSQILADVYRRSNDRQVQLQAILANSIVLKSQSENLLFMADMPEGLERSIATLASAVEHQSAVASAKAIQVCHLIQSGARTYFDLPHAEAAALLRFAMSRSFHGEPRWRLSDPTSGMEIASLNQIIDAFECCANMSLEQEMRSNFLSVRFAITMSDLHCGFKSRDDDDLATAVAALDFARKRLLMTGTGSHVIWIEWYQAYARAAPWIGLRGSQVQSFVHVADLLSGLGSTSRLPYLAAKRGEAVRSEFNEPILPPDFAPQVKQAVGSIVEFIAEEPPTLKRKPIRREV